MARISAQEKIKKDMATGKKRAVKELKNGTIKMPSKVPSLENLLNLGLKRLEVTIRGEYDPAKIAKALDTLSKMKKVEDEIIKEKEAVAEEKPRSRLEQLGEQLQSTVEKNGIDATSVKTKKK